ncbi:glycosyl hydrolase [Spirillospora sp. NBC_00431]
MSNTVSRRTLLKASAIAVAGAVPAGAVPAGAVPAGPAAAQAGGGIVAAPSGSRFAERFRAPGLDAYPKFEWFVPLALMTDAEIIREVKAMADAGIRSAEMLAWAAAGVNPATHGWGTAAWNSRVRTVLEAARQHGVAINLVIGPELPSGVPSITQDDPGASAELVYGHVTVRGGSTFRGKVPPPGRFDVSDPSGRPDRRTGTPRLVAVTAARVAGAGTTTGGPTPLDPTSLTDLTASVRDGRIAWTAPGGGRWLMFGFWRRGTGQTVDGAPAPSFVIDHYGAAGADSVTRFWDRWLLTPPIRRLLRETGGGVHEETPELTFILPWTTSLLQAFRDLRGYPLAPYLPVLFVEGLHNHRPGADPDPGRPPDFDLADGNGPRVRADFYQALTSLYERHHLDVIGRWAAGHGLTHSAKLGYSLTMDVSSTVRHLDEPETDQSFSAPETDVYRAIAGAAHMGRVPLYTSEVAPVTDELGRDAYGVTWPRMLQIINHNYAGGVTQAKLHYFSYAEAPGAGWPGWAPFAPLRLGPDEALPGFAEAWGPRQPTWRHMPDITGYLARLQFVLRTGRPNVDVAIYRHSQWDSDSRPLFKEPAMRRAGHTYEFIGPAQLDLPTAHVTGGRLDPGGPGYRAIVLDRPPTLTLEAARKILAHARAGLAVVVVGPPPGRTPYAKDIAAQDAALAETVIALLGHPRVRQVSDGSMVPGALAALGVRPSSEFRRPSDVLTLRRTDADTDFYYFFNTGEDTARFEVALAGKGRPYFLDAWTGEISPIPVHTTGDGRTRVSMTLRPRQTALLALCPGTRFGAGPLGTAPRTPAVTATDADLILSTATALAARAAKPGGYSVTLGDGRTLHVGIPVVPAPRMLSQWHLRVADHRPGPSPSITVEHIHDLELTGLRAWTELPGLADVSGVGRYTTTFDLGPAWTGGHGAYLHLGQVNGTVRVRANGRRTSPVDLNDPVVDLGGHLRRGRNTVEIEVATTLRNRLRTLSPEQATMPRQPYGLIGPVVLRPYGQAEILGTA